MNNNNQNSDFILYTSQDGEIRVDVFVNNETVWLTQKAMQELFDRSKSTVSEHISNVFKEGELEENQVVRNSEQLLMMVKIMKFPIIILM